MPKDGFKKRDGYLEKGKPKSGSITLLVLGKSERESSLATKKLTAIIKALKIKHLILTVTEKVDFPESETSGTLLVVKPSNKNRVCALSVAFCGRAKLDLTCADASGLFASIEREIARFNAKNLKTTVSVNAHTVTVKTEYYDEDEFEKLTMAVSRVAAPYFPQVNSVYAYPPARTDADLARFISLTLGADEQPYEITNEEQETIAPLSNNGRVVIVETGLEE